MTSVLWWKNHLQECSRQCGLKWSIPQHIGAPQEERGVILSSPLFGAGKNSLQLHLTLTFLNQQKNTLHLSMQYFSKTFSSISGHKVFKVASCKQCIGAVFRPRTQCEVSVPLIPSGFVQTCADVTRSWTELEVPSALSFLISVEYFS